MTHVALSVLEIGTRAARSRDLQQRLRIVESIDLVARLGQQVSMPALPTREVEYTRAIRKPENVDDARSFGSIPLELEDRLVFEKVAGVEIRLPPFSGFLQKKTGSLYAPKTSSIAARIS